MLSLRCPAVARPSQLSEHQNPFCFVNCTARALTTEGILLPADMLYQPEWVVSGLAAYLVVAHERVGRQLPFAFLEKVRGEFQDKHAESSRTLHAHSLDKTFG